MDTLRRNPLERQAPTRDQVTQDYGRELGLSDEAAHSRIRKIESELLGLIRFYARKGADNRIERVLTRAKLAARPTGAIDCSDRALLESSKDVHETDQRNDSARFFTVADGPLPNEESTELRATYAEISELQQHAQLLEARAEARR